MRGTVRPACLLAIALLTAQLQADARPNPIDEVQAKAGFLFNCAMFIEWPGTAGTGEFTIGVLGADPLVEVMSAMNGRTVKGRVLKVRAAQPQDDPRGFRVLFLGDVAAKDAAAVLARTANEPVLTVGEARDFTSQGGIVRLYTEQDHLKFEVNVTRADHAGLKVNARMLALARIVR